MALNNYVGLDFETYASTDLLTHGLHRYINCPDFRPLLAAVIWYNHDVFDGFDGAVCDFVEDYEDAKERMLDGIGGSQIVAHNATFEQNVLARMGIDLPSDRFVDSAVLARAAGAAGKLEAAAPQLLGVEKLESGYELIKLFSIPGKYQEKNNSLAFDPAIRLDHINEWAEFARYCGVDAELSLRLANKLLPQTSKAELEYTAITMDMNNTGWHVDLEMVENMSLRYRINLANAEAEFRAATDAQDLNLSSYPQLKAWCAERGVRSNSFDEKAIERMIKTLDRRVAVLEKSHPTPANLSKKAGYGQVLHLLHTKQVLGGSSLKKLQTILDTTGKDGRLHDQYLHIGAGASYRTTGRGVQMQNLKRLNGQGDDMELLFEDTTEWDNDKLASNLRQVFTASDPNGFLIVGDFSSVESRGLAWQAGEQWKLDAYAKGHDLYEVLAGKIFNIPAEKVIKAERQVGKVGELACGYGAGPDAVKDFAEKMGVSLSEEGSARLVKDWRDANPKIVNYWERLNYALHGAIIGRIVTTVAIPHGVVEIFPRPAPKSLSDQVGDPHLVSLYVRMVLNVGPTVLTRVIHGAHIVGKDVLYWKPSERKTGDLWADEFMNPKTKQLQKHKIYGGKLAGILTQSLCREMFFESLSAVHRRLAAFNGINLLLVGQFHDEIVLDWTPGALSLNGAMTMLEQCMTTTSLPGFPLGAEIKHDYRYTK